MLKVVDLFSGAGGLSLGFLKVKDCSGEPAYQIVKAVEKDDAACETLKGHFKKQSLPVCDVLLKGDIENETVKEEIIQDGMHADVVIGGPPCQTYSLVSLARVGSIEMRRKHENDPRNTLYKHFMEIVGGIRPSFVVFENVEGMASKKIADTSSGKTKRVIELVTGELATLGYDTSVMINGRKQDYMMLDAADYGVPQHRKRIIIIANNINVTNPLPVPRYGEIAGKPYKNIDSAIKHLPPVLPPINTINFGKIKKMDLLMEHREEYLGCFVNAVKSLVDRYKGGMYEDRYFRLRDTIKEAYDRFISSRSNDLDVLRTFVDAYNENISGLDGTILDQGDFPAPHISRPHNIRDICIFSRMKQGVNSARFMRSDSDHYDEYLSMIYPYKTESHRDTYVRQSWGRPSSTILSHMDRDGLRFIHPEQPRSFTPCEAALLQTFDNDSKLHGRVSEIYRQVGNAVPPLMGQAIAQAIYETLKERENNTEVEMDCISQQVQ